VTKPELAQYAKEDGTGRAYQHPFRKLDSGKPLTVPSVTTILGLVDKPALMQWAADKTLEWAVDNASLLFTKDRDSAVKSGRWRWKDVRDSRAEVGTGIHETIESLNTGGWNFPRLDEEQNAIMARYHEFLDRYTITPHLSEFTVFGCVEQPQAAWAGTGDGLWDVVDNQTGESWENLVIDLKTSRNTWDEHWLQVAALRHAEVIMEKQADGTWIEKPMPTTAGAALIHLRADKWEFLLEDDDKISDLQYSQFMGYRLVWENKKAIEKAKKDREAIANLSF
jgi:hypothetical protein